MGMDVASLDGQSVVTETFLLSDVSRFLSATVQLAGTWVGTVSYEQSNDGTNWVALAGMTASSIGGSLPASSDTANGMRVFPLFGRYFRVRWTRTSGTILFRTLFADLPVINNIGAFISGGQTIPVKPTFDANAPGNLTAYLRSLATVNLTSVKTSAGNVIDIFALNTNAAIRYLKLYNKASAPVVASDVPVLVIPLPPSQQIRIAPNGPIRFATGIAYAMTAAIANTDATAVAADEITGFINYV